MQCAKLVFTILLCVSALISCGLWIKSATVQAPYVEVVSETGWTNSAITRRTDKDTFDIIATADLQTKWNKWAAGFAAASAICQAILAYITY